MKTLLASVIPCFVALGMLACGEVETEASGPDEKADCTSVRACDGEDKQVASQSECPQDDARCYERSMCGATIWCTGPSEAICQALPACEVGSSEVETCPADASCTTQTLCGKTITCLDTANCAAVPTCDGDDKQVASQSECPQDDARCYERSMCGATIWCTGPSSVNCEAVPVCPAGSAEVATCPADASCTPQTLCGKTITCMDMANCAALPVCDLGDTQVASQSGCLQDDARCYERSLCGVTIWCTGPS